MIIIIINIYNNSNNNYDNKQKILCMRLIIYNMKNDILLRLKKRGKEGEKTTRIGEKTERTHKMIKRKKNWVKMERKMKSVSKY